MQNYNHPKYLITNPITYQPTGIKMNHHDTV